MNRRVTTDGSLPVAEDDPGKGVRGRLIRRRKNMAVRIDREPDRRMTNAFGDHFHLVPTRGVGQADRRIGVPDRVEVDTRT